MRNVVYKEDEEYPELLRKIGKDAPKQIYYKVRCHPEQSPCHPERSEGSIDSSAMPQNDKRENAQNDERENTQNDKRNITFDQSIFNNCLAVVGSRKLTHYGEQAIERIVGEVALSGITIVSGFMYGGDALAHQTALRVGGRTIAVMPCGIDRISPEDQEELYNDIIDNKGMIISEYEGDMTPALWTYPRRNRIVAGLSKAVLVIEAGEKSGSLITANLAKKFNRKIFAVPGPITSSVSKGTNMLIKNGAEMVLSAKDILRWFRGDKKTSHCHPEQSPCHPERSEGSIDSSATPQNDKGGNTQNGNTEEQILSFLEREPLGIDEMSRHLEISVSELGVKLSMMEMQGLIELKGNKYYNIK